MSRATAVGTYTIICFCIFIINGQIDDDSCECVPYYLCDNGTINTNGENVIDIRLGGDCTYLETCCHSKDVIQNTTTRRLPMVPKQSGCGRRNPDGVGFRITGNTDETAFGEFPWMVALLYKGDSDDKYKYKCGGTLIHPQVVLTAAHCIIEGSYMVRAGEWDTKTTQEFLKHQEKKVTSGTIHRDFKRTNLQNDVGLLFLESPFNISEYINVACLPLKNNVVVSDNCFVTGWGKDKFEADGVYQNILKRIEVPVIGREKCQEAFRKTRLGKHFQLHRSFICAGGQEGKDACTGDGGGPLVCPIEGQDEQYQQVGIVAWGIGCGTEGVPGAYVDIAYFRDWIDDQMKRRKFDVGTYQF